ncbi:MAG: glycosyl transferase family 2 [Marinilabiliales bacterium]|nr:MAG: glycosyl transferase family 2 [Marinilabiliales bacterium]
MRVKKQVQPCNLLIRIQFKKNFFPLFTFHFPLNYLNYFCPVMLFDPNFPEHPLYLLILLGSLASSVFIFLFYYFVFFSRLAWYKEKTPKKQRLPSVSIVIAAKNEYLNLKENLPFILTMDYPDYEVIVVDDHSQDDTNELLADFKLMYSRLKVLTLKDSLTFFEGKKFPLSIGIKEAKNEVLLLTDADCKPASNDWIKHMVSQYDENTELVLGYGKFYRRKWSLLSMLVRYDTLHSAIQYFSAALSGFPYMGVGRNLSYKRRLFLESDGFTSHYDVISGDDDIFVSQHARKKNCRICLRPQSFVYSRSKKRLGSWWHQKKRHFTTGKHYRFGTKLYLGLYHLNTLLFPAIAITVLLLKYNILISGSLILMKVVSQWIIFGKAAGKLKEKKLLLISPILEIVFAIVNPLIHISNMIKQPGRWK